MWCKKLVPELENHPLVNCLKEWVEVAKQLIVYKAGRSYQCRLLMNKFITPRFSDSERLTMLVVNVENGRCARFFEVFWHYLSDLKQEILHVLKMSSTLAEIRFIFITWKIFFFWGGECQKFLGCEHFRYIIKQVLL